MSPLLPVLTMMFSNSRLVVEPAGDVERVLELLARRRRRHADLAGGDLLALLLDRLDDVLRHQPARLQLVRIEPDPHRILAGAEHGDVADAGQARQLVPQVDGGVVGQEQAVVAGVRRRQRHEQQDRGRLLLHRDALVLHRLRQLRQRGRDAVLHQHLREVQVGADLEGDRQRIGAVGGAVGLHVEHVLDAVDLLLDRQRDGVDHGLGAGAGIAGGDLHRRRHDVGILRDREADTAHTAPIRTIRMAMTLARTGRSMKNFEIMAGPSLRCRAGLDLLACGSTFWPGIARSNPPTTTLSSGFSPLSMTRSSPSSCPVVTLRCSTTFSALTTST